MKIFQMANLLLKHCGLQVMYKLCGEINYFDSRFAEGETGRNERSAPGCHPHFPGKEAQRFSDATDVQTQATCCSCDFKVTFLEKAL